MRHQRDFAEAGPFRRLVIFMRGGLWGGLASLFVMRRRRAKGQEPTTTTTTTTVHSNG